MNIKRTLATLFVATSLVVTSSSVLAESSPSAGEVTPMIIGVGDTKAQAIDIFNDQEYNLFLQTAEDQDWFKWTNTTGEAKFVMGWLDSLNQANVLNLAAVIHYDTTNTRYTTILNAEPTNASDKSESGKIRNLYIPAGATLYFKVNALNFNSAAQYKLQFFVF
ncbi:hypothetical protein [Paenibacillus sp. Y412MC10]|uniref:hypothetical protein n=1 Tax=Geobacillus sp. (strain Y412MC10) TaxID=481743 RepID=UPI0011A3AAEC|nr:hypothetical protein [Paenibacillus sp. Y412MC10]